MSKVARGILLPLLATAAGIFPAGEADAAVVSYTLEDLARKSKYVLTGEVIEMRSYRAPFLDLGDVIFTDVKLRIDSVLKGAPGGTEVTIRILGGQIGTAFQTCAESARYEKGEKVLVFVREWNGALWNTGWLQGKYRLSADGTQVHGVEGLPVAHEMTFATLREQVLKTVSAATAPPSGPSQPVLTPRAKEGGR